jgi:membrane-bound lytic murein transglycosylase B
MIKSFLLFLGFSAGIYSCQTHEESPSASDPLETKTFASPEEEFADCLKHRKAIREGFSEEELEILESLQFMPDVLESYKTQPENLKNFRAYLQTVLNQDNVRIGYQKVKDPKLQDAFNDIESKFGVERELLVALWGLETSYGRFFGKAPVLDALATHACLAPTGRRKFYQSQLRTSLRLVGESRLDRNVVGSWSGAFGHMQFMPETFQRYAMDFDGSGKIDFASPSKPEDALGSAANYLAQIGWQKDIPWGMRVDVPSDEIIFDHLVFGFKNVSWDNLKKKKVAEWRELGVTVKRTDLDPEEAVLYFPMGIYGPKFLLFSNFLHLYDWNRSAKYVVAAGHLFDLIADRTQLKDLNLQPHPKEPKEMTLQQLVAVQNFLIEAGFDPGHADGVYGAQTALAIHDYQRQKGFLPDGYPYLDQFPDIDFTNKLTSGL